MYTDSYKVHLLNIAANHPAVRPWLAPGNDPLELSRFFDEPNNLLLGDERGVVLFVWLGEGFYACHMILTPALRGRDALTALRKSFTSLFTLRDAVAITGLITRENRASRAIVRALGCRPIGTANDPGGRSCISYIMERATWATYLAQLEACSAAPAVTSAVSLPSPTTSPATTI